MVSPPTYRKEAIAYRATTMSSQQLVQLTPPHLWLTLAVIWLILIIVVIWGFLGTIPTRAMGGGILVGEGGGIYNAVAPPGTNEIIELPIIEGQYVKKGQTVAHLRNPDLIKKIEVTQNYIQELQTKYEDLQTTAKEKIKALHHNLAEERQSLENSLKSQTESLSKTEELLKIKTAAYKKGLLTRQDVAMSEQNFYNTKLSLEDIKAKLVELKQQEDRTINEWHDRLRTQENQLAERKNELAQLKAQLLNSQDVKSPFDGIISGIHHSVSDKVAEGTPILSIAQTGKGLDAIVFIPAQFGQQVTLNMEALLTPLFIKKEEFGSLEGYVIDVNIFPSTTESIQALLHNDELVKSFTATGPASAMRVRLIGDKGTRSGFKWTSRQGPPDRITAGMLVTVQVNLRHQAPVSLIIPMFKKLLGS